MVYLDDKASNDWMAASGGSYQLDSGFGGGTEQLAENLLNFLFEFRTAGTDPEPEAAPGAQGSSGSGAGSNVHEPTSRFDVFEPAGDPWAEDPYSGADHQVAEGWWMAADGRWYAPELHPDFQAHPMAEAAADETGPSADGPDTGSAAVSSVDAKRFGLLRRGR